MANHYFLLTAFGKDQPGIVADVAHTLFTIGGNVEDASMTRLGGEFTIMLVVALPSKVSTPQFTKALRALEKKRKLTIQMKPVPPALVLRPKHSEPQYLISVYGTDKPGIVYRVTQVLSNRLINITDLNTRVAQRSGQPLYVMILEVQTPADLNVDELQKELTHLGSLLGVEITLQEMDPVVL